MPVLPRRPSALLAPLAPLLAALLLPAAALASPEALIRDCQDGTISGNYSARDFSQALKDIPTDVDEYTDCRDVIRRAQLGAAGGSRGGAGGGSAGAGDSVGGGGASGGTGASPGAPATAERILASASPQERAAIRRAAASAGAPPVEVAGTSIDPEQIARGARTTSSTLPGPLLGALILIGLAALAACAHRLWTRAAGRRPAL